MDKCRVVLVRPHYAGNIGSIARAMHNFGLSRLLLVDPVANPLDAEARRLSTHGEFILQQAQIVATLPEALHDCVLAAATSAKVEGVVRETGSGTIRHLMPVVASTLRSGPVALVFGPEPSGLTTAEVGLCHYLLTIPTNPESPALNLSHAVALCLYELHLAWEAAGESRAPLIATIADQERMFTRLQAALEAIHFLYGPKADSLMYAVRHLIGRAQPTPTEVRILHGLARQLEWVVAHGTKPHDPQHPDNR